MDDLPEHFIRARLGPGRPKVGSKRATGIVPSSEADYDFNDSHAEDRRSSSPMDEHDSSTDTHRGA